MDNFLHRYFNNSHEQALQVDEEGLFHDITEYEYRIKFGVLNEDGFTDWNEKPRWTKWIKYSPRDFINFSKNRGVSITIFEHSKRMKKEIEPL